MLQCLAISEASLYRVKNIVVMLIMRWLAMNEDGGKNGVQVSEPKTFNATGSKKEKKSQKCVLLQQITKNGKKRCDSARARTGDLFGGVN